MTGQCNKFASLTNGQSNFFDFKTKIPSQKNHHPKPWNSQQLPIFPHVEKNGLQHYFPGLKRNPNAKSFGICTARKPSWPWKQKVGGAGFEPAKAEPTDLQSVPFDRFGTPPIFPGDSNQRPKQAWPQSPDFSGSQGAVPKRTTKATATFANLPSVIQRDAPLIQEPAEGFEPTTYGLQNHCSAN